MCQLARNETEARITRSCLGRPHPVQLVLNRLLAAQIAGREAIDEARSPGRSMNTIQLFILAVSKFGLLTTTGDSSYALT
jgi:hypothetical protein